MSTLHQLCHLGARPIISEAYTETLKYLLNAGIPCTYTLEERIIYEFEQHGHTETNKESLPEVPAGKITEILKKLTNGDYEAAEEELSNIASKYFYSGSSQLVSTTTPLHLLCYNVPEDITDDEVKVVGELIEELFLNGTGWNLVDYSDNTPGCVLIDRKLTSLPIYDQILEAGVRAEMVFRKIDEANIEFIEEGEQEEENDENEEIPALISGVKEESISEPEVSITKKEKTEKVEDPADNQKAYLEAKLEYKNNALITADNKDGIMMNWETKLMKLGCDTLFKGISAEEIQAQKNPKGSEEEDDVEEINLLNIGFGMGIIDTFIQEKIHSSEYSGVKINHFICEAHPEVLAKLKQDGWYEKPNVKIIAGRWQDELDKLLNEGTIFFNGIYYDTFSEHYYPDMFPNLVDLLIGMIKPHGIISFFNGLGADRQVVYDLYCKIVKLDLTDYGFDVKFEAVSIDADQENTELNKGADGVWSDVKRSYWNCPVYYHPEIKFA